MLETAPKPLGLHQRLQCHTQFVSSGEVSLLRRLAAIPLCRLPSFALVTQTLRCSTRADFSTCTCTGLDKES